MPHLRILTTLAWALALVAPVVEAQVRVGDPWNSISIPSSTIDAPGTREAALGGAGTLLVRGAAAAWWNPARLAGATPGMTAHSYALYPHHPFGHFRHQFLAASRQAGARGLGVGLSANRTVDHEHTRTDEMGNVLGTGRSTATELILSAGLHLGERWNVGAGVRSVERDGSPFVSQTRAWALEGGLVWRAQAPLPLLAGISLANVGTL